MSVRKSRARAEPQSKRPLRRDPSAGARSAEELTAWNVETIIRLDEVERAKRSLADRIADLITSFCGSMTFVWVHAVFFGAWILLNVWPGWHPFDAYPFPFLTLVVSLEAIFLSTFILISENRQARMTERRNHLDLQINLLSEQENTKMLTLLEAIAHKVGAPVEPGPAIRVFAETTQPDQLAAQIDRSMEKSEKNK